MAERPTPQTAMEPDITTLIGDITSGKLSLFDLIRSGPTGDYRAHVNMMRVVVTILSDVGVAKALQAALQAQIAEHPNNSGRDEAVEKQLARKDGHRRFNKLINQKAQTFKEGHSPAPSRGARNVRGGRAPDDRG